MTTAQCGKVNGCLVRISAGVVVACVIAAPGGIGAQSSQGTSRNQSTIIISLKTAGGPPSHCSNAALASMYFTDARSVAAYYLENSYGLMNISGTVTGPHVVSLRERWSPASLADEADAAATADGVNLNLYSQKVYVLPKEADPNPIQSGWGGQSNRAQSRIWIRDYWCSSKHVAAHNFGHILGLNHASTPADEYGDYSSPMGKWLDPASDPSTWNDMPHYNAPGKIAAGWLPDSAVQTVTASGKFLVTSVETLPAPGQIQALKIKGGSEGADYYYFSFRQALGFSSSLTPQYLGLTSVTRWNGAAGSKTCLLANLADGQAFDASGVMVAQSSHDSGRAYLTVTFGSAPSNVKVACPRE